VESVELFKENILSTMYQYLYWSPVGKGYCRDGLKYHDTPATTVSLVNGTYHGYVHQQAAGWGGAMFGDQTFLHFWDQTMGGRGGCWVFRCLHKQLPESTKEEHQQACVEAAQTTIVPVTRAYFLTVIAQLESGD
jgi:hypothetical protein